MAKLHQGQSGALDPEAKQFTLRMEPMVHPRRRTSRSASSAATLLLLAAGLLGCGPAPEGSAEPSSQAIVGGQVSTEHKNVFGLVVHVGNRGATCTATLIAPNVLLTARHCVSPGPDSEVICGAATLGKPYPAEDLYASNAVHMREATRWFQGASIHVPSEGNDTCGYDVALVVLGQNVPPSVATPAVPRIDREVEEGEPYTAVGYGVADNEESGGRMVLGDLEVGCTPGSCGSGVRISEFQGDTGICEGDSGGPALDLDGKVVGVVSRGANECDSPVYGSVKAWRAFITDVTLQAAQRGRYEPPFWATSGVSDPPAADVGEACEGSRSCADGLSCYRAAGEDIAECVARCSSDGECADGLQCRSVDGAELCLAPRGGDSGAACSLAPSRDARNGGGGAALLALGAIVGMTLARRGARRQS